METSRKRMRTHVVHTRTCNWPKMEKLLNDWAINQRINNCCITGPILRVKAYDFYLQECVNKNDQTDPVFSCSNGWFNKRRKKLPRDSNGKIIRK